MTKKEKSCSHTNLLLYLEEMYNNFPNLIIKHLQENFGINFDDASTIAIWAISEKEEYKKIYKKYCGKFLHKLAQKLNKTAKKLRKKNAKHQNQD